MVYSLMVSSYKRHVAHSQDIVNPNALLAELGLQLIQRNGAGVSYSGSATAYSMSFTVLAPNSSAIACPSFPPRKRICRQLGEYT